MTCHLVERVSAAAHVAGFTDTIGSVLQAAHNSSQMLTLEVTETALLRDRERALLVLTDLKDMGVSLPSTISAPATRR